MGPIACCKLALPAVCRYTQHNSALSTVLLFPSKGFGCKLLSLAGSGECGLEQSLC